MAWEKFKYAEKDTVLPAKILVVDEVAELVDAGSDRSKMRLADTVQDNFQSIARLGRAASIHLVMATQSASGNIFPSSLKNNIAERFVCGRVADNISNMAIDSTEASALPTTKGAYLGYSNKETLTFQGYFTPTEKVLELGTIREGYDPKTGLKIEKEEDLASVEEIIEEDDTTNSQQSPDSSEDDDDMFSDDDMPEIFKKPKKKDPQEESLGDKFGPDVMNLADAIGDDIFDSISNNKPIEIKEHKNIIEIDSDDLDADDEFGGGLFGDSFDEDIDSIFGKTNSVSDTDIFSMSSELSSGESTDSSPNKNNKMKLNIGKNKPNVDNKTNERKKLNKLNIGQKNSQSQQKAGGNNGKSLRLNLKN